MTKSGVFGRGVQDPCLWNRTEGKRESESRHKAEERTTSREKSDFRGAYPTGRASG